MSVWPEPVDPTGDGVHSDALRGADDDGMMGEPGEKLIGLLDGIGSGTLWDVRPPDGAGDAWRLAGAAWRAGVIADPSKWIGLTFELADPVYRHRVNYAIDTDLYDISRPDQREFAGEIENNIIEFLDNLRGGRVMCGRAGSQLTMVIPRRGAFIRLVGGRFLTRGSTHAKQSDALKGGAYVLVV